MRRECAVRSRLVSDLWPSDEMNFTAAIHQDHSSRAAGLPAQFVVPLARQFVQLRSPDTPL